MFGSLGNFVGETKQELKKVTWPTRRDVWESTRIVIIATFIIGFYIGFIDVVLSGVMRLLFG